MTVLVTGSTGFLGRHLVSALLEKGIRVTALVRRPEPELEARGVTIAIGDVLDQESVERAASGCEGVFHCAGKVSRRREDAGELQKVHVEGTKIVLDAAKAHGRTSGQIVLRWHVQQEGVVAIPRTTKNERLKENIDIFDFSLSDAEMAAISALSRAGSRLCSFGFSPAWDE